MLSEHGLPIAPSTYHEGNPTAREQRDDVLKAEITRVHEASYGGYGAGKVWLSLNRENTPVVRCNVERPMGVLCLAARCAARLSHHRR